MTDDLLERFQDVLGGSYRLERELPGGGMSRLFLATESGLERPVVIKLLPPELEAELSSRRFRREIAVTARLRHPHILPMLTSGSRDDLLWYVMPYVDGESLRHRLERSDTGLPIADATRLFDHIVDAVAYAHRRGVVHRDIKPENILLEGDHAMLADFGVARALEEARSGGGRGRITRTGERLGTMGYMPPEQMAGAEDVDERADVYALAVVAYEMFAGRPPFVAATPADVAAMHLAAEPLPLRAVRPAVPARVSAAVTRALSKEPERRFRSAVELREALGRPAPRASRPWLTLLRDLFAPPSTPP